MWSNKVITYYFCFLKNKTSNIPSHTNVVSIEFVTNRSFILFEVYIMIIDKLFEFGKIRLPD